MLYKVLLNGEVELVIRFKKKRCFVRMFSLGVSFKRQGGRGFYMK
jgi:hypothetical protein